MSFWIFKLSKVFKNEFIFLSCSMSFLVNSFSYCKISLRVDNSLRIFTKTSIILMLIFYALLLLSTFASCKTPCSVKTKGKYLLPPQLEVTICDLKFLNSSPFNSNIKCNGKISIFRFTACEALLFQLHKARQDQDQA